MVRKYWSVTSAVCLVGQLAAPLGAYAGALSFGGIRPVGLAATGDSAEVGTLNNIAADNNPVVAASPTGVVVALWRSGDYMLPGDTEDQDIVIARSEDRGVTWDGPNYFVGDGSSAEEGWPAVATDGAGTWVVTWNPAFGYTRKIDLSRSTDDGLTWSAPQSIVMPPGGAERSDPFVSSDGGSNWIIAFALDPFDSDADIFYSASADSGATWSSAVALNSDSAVDSANDFRPRLAADGNGNWGAIWDRGASSHFSRSEDNGASWSPPISLGSGSSIFPDIATDGDGVWLASWDGDDSNNDNKVFSVRSIDAGATWTARAPIPGPGQNDNHAAWPSRLVALGDSHFAAVWGISYDNFGSTKKSDFDLLYSETFDGGLSWDPPSLLNLNGRTDGKDTFDLDPAIAYDGAGTTIVVWPSNDSLGDTIGQDWDIVSATSTNDCPPVAMETCIATSQSGSARISIKDGRGGRDKLKWKWSKGLATSVMDFGDPTTTSSYALCMYAIAGSGERVVFEEDIPAATTCGGSPCWAPFGSGYRYDDRRLEHGSVKRMRLAPGADGQASVEILATGPFLGPPALPMSLATPIRVQLVNTQTDACWEAVYSSSVSQSTSRFKGSSD